MASNEPNVPRLLRRMQAECWKIWLDGWPANRGLAQEDDLTVTAMDGSTGK